MDEIIFKPHSLKQERAIFSEKPILLLGTGTQWGKTSVGALRMKDKLHTFTEKDDHFLVTSPTYKTLMQSTLPPFMKFMAGYGEYNKKEDIFEMFNGGIVYFRTETDPDSIVGITNIRHIWGDEAGKYRLYFWENMQARADFFGCPIDLTTSPYALNWIFQDIIKPFRKGLRPDVEFIQAASWENPYHSLFSAKNRKEKRLVMDERRFNMLYGGKWDKMEGLVYDIWDDDENYVPAFSLPGGTRFFGGIDWGYYPDPFALKIRAVTPDGRHFGISEFVKTKLTINDIVEVCRQKKNVFNIQAFFCDPSQPGYIEELNRAKLNARGANNDIRKGIDLHYELIKTRRYKEFTGECPHSKNEREVYHYPEPKDMGPDENKKEIKPVDQNNHCMDVDRYITIETYTSHLIKPPRVPEDESNEIKSHEHRLNLLKKSNRNKKAERWT